MYVKWYFRSKYIGWQEVGLGKAGKENCYDLDCFAISNCYMHSLLLCLSRRLKVKCAVEGSGMARITGRFPLPPLPAGSRRSFSSIWYACRSRPRTIRSAQPQLWKRAAPLYEDFVRWCYLQLPQDSTLYSILSFFQRSRLFSSSEKLTFSTSHNLLNKVWRKWYRSTT